MPIDDSIHAMLPVILTCVVATLVFLIVKAFTTPSILSKYTVQRPLLRYGNTLAPQLKTKAKPAFTLRSTYGTDGLTRVKTSVQSAITALRAIAVPSTVCKQDSQYATMLTSFDTAVSNLTTYRNINQTKITPELLAQVNSLLADVATYRTAIEAFPLCSVWCQNSATAGYNTSTDICTCNTGYGNPSTATGEVVCTLYPENATLQSLYNDLNTAITNLSAAIITPAVNASVAPPTLSGFTPSSGALSSSVTISGTGFTNASSVTFGGIEATFVVNSDTQITANASGSGFIAVTGLGGTVSSASQFTIV